MDDTRKPRETCTELIQKWCFLMNSCSNSRRKECCAWAWLTRSLAKKQLSCLSSSGPFGLFLFLLQLSSLKNTNGRNIFPDPLTSTGKTNYRNRIFLYVASLATVNHSCLETCSSLNSHLRKAGSKLHEDRELLSTMRICGLPKNNLR